MVQPTRPPANGFVRNMRHVYNPIGFSKGYNFILFFIFGGALIGFALARLPYLSFSYFCAGGRQGASPGECFIYTRLPRYKVGIIMHLAGILPAALLAVFQFVPAIRHKAILYHRMAGYVIISLVLVGNVGALMIADKAFGGHPTTRAAVGLLALITTMGIGMAVWNIKKLQIDQHRAWMLRVWFWLACIITTRFIMFTSAPILSMLSGKQHVAMSCARIESIYKSVHPVIEKYPECGGLSGDSWLPEKLVIVQANFDAGPECIAAVLELVFPMALWLALAIHAAGIEIYLKLTPRESERLREVSAQRQAERGMLNPGSAGLVVERFGDAEPWVRREKQEEIVRENSIKSTHGDQA